MSISKIIMAATILIAQGIIVVTYIEGFYDAPAMLVAVAQLVVGLVIYYTFVRFF